MKKRINFLTDFLIIFMAFMMLNTIAYAEATPETGVAKIGETVYETLEEAVANSKEGDTITLINDIDTTTYMTTSSADDIVLEFKENMTLDLNNHTINTNNMDLIYTGINLTIKNGYFTTLGSYALFIGDMVDTDNVLIENVLTKGGLNIFNATNVTLKNVDSIGQNYYAVWADEHAMVTILSGNYSTKGNYVLGITSTKDTGSYIHVMGGNYTTTTDNLVLPSPFESPVIYGGTFDTDPTIYKETNAKVRTLDNGFYEVYYEKTIDVPTIDEDKIAEKVEIGISDKENTIDIIDRAFTKLNIIDKNSQIVINNELVEPESDLQNKMLNTITNTYKEAKIVNYFDITIKVIDTDTNNILTSITELDEKIKFKVLIPNELLNNDDSINRKYYIIREHADLVEILDTSLSENGKSLEFLSDKFSTYALAYVDEKITEEPKPEEPVEQPDNKDENVNKPEENPSEEPDDKDEPATDPEEKPSEKPDIKDEPTKEPEKIPSDKPAEKDETINNKPDNKEETSIENPKTFDSLVSYLIISGVSIAGAVTIGIYFKKKVI